jgi:hypothetical protein
VAQVGLASIADSARNTRTIIGWIAMIGFVILFAWWPTMSEIATATDPKGTRPLNACRWPAGSPLKVHMEFDGATVEGR